jgi:transcription-repair coupling factor (superfamily II helicase)
VSFARDLREIVSGRAVVSAVADALDAGGSVRLAGTAGSAGALAALALVERRRQGVVVVLPSEDEVRLWARDLRAFAPDPERILENPPLDVSEEETSVLDAFAGLGDRLRILRSLAERPARPLAVLTSMAGLLEHVPSREAVARAALELRKGATLDVAELVRVLVAAGLSRVPLVESSGEFAVRGGLVDVFPIGTSAPVRIELFGDEVESLRAFEPGTQRSTVELERVALPLVGAPEYVRARREDRSTLLDHLPERTALVLVDLPRSAERARGLESRTMARERGDLAPASSVARALALRPRVFLGELEAEETAKGPFALPSLVPRLDLGALAHDAPKGHHQEIADGLQRIVSRGDRVTVVCLRGSERKRLAELLGKAGVAVDVPPEGEPHELRSGESTPGVSLVTGTLEAGFRFPDARVLVCTSSELLGRYQRLAVARTAKRALSQGHRAIESFSDLEPGEAVVHVAHGIGLFRGLVRLEKDGKHRDHLALEYDEGALLYVPAERIGLVRRYIGPGGAPPKLSKLGGQAWKKKAHAAERAVRDLANDLLHVQAARRVQEGTKFPEDDEWQRDFEESFPFQETEDQGRAAEQVKADMCSTRPMDRLLVGDVGYGKTEVAMRAAFKCATSGKQVAVLVPTTILALQHGKTFSERMRDYPVRIDTVSRFRSKKDQKEAVRKTAAGELDVLIGTHRLLSRDIVWKDLGLIIIDEEQRFGVEHKERLKALRQTVDVLTLSATPIPRTLHMALSGAREISALTQPPEGRLAVETKVVRYDTAIVKRAIERELARDGQIFFIHDRVQTIDKVAQQVADLVPEARIVVAHGQLPEEDLETRMLGFLEGDYDVLVSTTIVENGLDIPRANTLIVNRAERFGLADLHQLRGRVGRTREKAYAYFLLPEKTALPEIAAKRLRAIEEFDELGAGFKIAMRDLEIRGAGNVLGAEQSGHLSDVGYDLYCRLLRRAVSEMRGEAEVKAELDLERDLDLEVGELELLLDVAAYVPDAYVDDVPLKIECYRKLSSATVEDDLRALEQELRDRFGPLPDVLTALFALRRLRIRAATLGVERIGRQDRVVVLSVREKAREQVKAALWRRKKDLREIDPRTLYLVLQDPSIDDEAVLHLLLKAFDPTPEPPPAPKTEKAARPAKKGPPPKPAGPPPTGKKLFRFDAARQPASGSERGGKKGER